MTRRVELDLLEPDGSIPGPAGEPAEAADGAGQAPEVRASLRFRFRNLLQSVVSRFKRPDVAFDWKILLSWKVLVPAGTFLVLLAAGTGTVLHLRSQEQARLAAEVKKQAAAAAVVPARDVAFTDFSIDLKDDGGRYRFLQCDITLEFLSPMDLTEDRKVEIRKVIYLSAKKKGRELIRVADSSDRFKKEMRVELQDLLGEEVLKDIYITRYLLI
jgi:flagellar basal body-associated protein FliL